MREEEVFSRIIIYYVDEEISIRRKQRCDRNESKAATKLLTLKRKREEAEEAAETELEEDDEEEEVDEDPCPICLFTYNEWSDSMISCDLCGSWSHAFCVGVNTDDPSIGEKDWFCGGCVPAVKKRKIERRSGRSGGRNMKKKTKTKKMTTKKNAPFAGLRSSNGAKKRKM